MSYVSFAFLLFVILLMAIYYISPQKYKWVVLLFGNIYFFVSLSGFYIIYCLLASFIIFLIAKLLGQERKKEKSILLLGIVLTLLFLIILKYNNFLISIINPILNLFKIQIPYKKFLMPVGISYYTLEMIAYLVDVYRKKTTTENNYFKLLTFFTYFPKLIEGPISRYTDMKDKMFEEKHFDYDKFRNAFVLIGYGFIKKLIIADRLGIYVDKVFENSYYGIVALLAVILYTIQIYCDFSGCINIISGISELFGIELPCNFKRPFFSKNIQEFWRRWHITLGEWLKDYIFYPVSLSKMNMKLNIKARKMKYKHLSKFIIIAFPLIFVWFINGLWHGASIKYILYGLYYYVLMMLGVLFKPLLEKLEKALKINTEVWSYNLFKVLRTIIIVCIGMLLFRSDNLNQFIYMFKGMFSLSLPVSIFSLGLTKKDFLIAGIYILIIFGIELSQELKINIREKLDEQNLIFRWVIYIFIIFSIIIFGVYGKGYEAKSFIYGGF